MAYPVDVPVTAASPESKLDVVSFRRIVVALDLSDGFSAVLKAALAVAGFYRSQLFLVHAASSSSEMIFAEPQAPVMKLLELEAAEAAMAEAIAREPQLESHEHRVVIEYGSAVDLVKSVVASESIDLVVAGSHGPTGLERLTMGSVAEAILRSVPCPVLMVGPNAIVKSALFRSVLLATNLGSTGHRPASYAASLARQLEGKLYLLHVREPIVSPGGEPAFSDLVAKLSMTRLLPEDLQHSLNVRLCVIHGKASTEISRLAHEKRVTLIVTGFKNESIWEGHSPFSTFSAIVREALCPVLGVRDPASRH